MSVDSYNLDMQEMNDDFGLLTCFVSLPSIRSLYGNIVEPQGIENPYFDDYGSEITKIHLKHSAVYSHYLKKVLEKIRSLKVFKYKYGISAYYDASWEPKSIVQSLLENHGHSLVTLELYESSPKRATAGFSPDRFIGSIRSFQALK